MIRCEAYCSRCHEHTQWGRLTREGVICERCDAQDGDSRSAEAPSRRRNGSGKGKGAGSGENRSDGLKSNIGATKRLKRNT